MRCTSEYFERPDGLLAFTSSRTQESLMEVDSDSKQYRMYIS